MNLFAPLLIDTAMMVFYLAVMLRYSPLLTFVGVLSILCNLGLQKQTKKKYIANRKFVPVCKFADVDSMEDHYDKL